MLEEIFDKRANIIWLDIEAILLHYGAETEGRGIARAYRLKRSARRVPSAASPERNGSRRSGFHAAFLVEAGIGVEGKK